MGGYELHLCCTELLSLLFQKSLSRSLRPKRGKQVSAKHRPRPPAAHINEEQRGGFEKKSMNEFKQLKAEEQRHKLWAKTNNKRQR